MANQYKHQLMNFEHGRFRPHFEVFICYGEELYLDKEDDESKTELLTAQDRSLMILVEDERQFRSS
jgi:hypothetical protein